MTNPRAAAPQPSRTTPDEHSPGWAGGVPAGASTVVAHSRERVSFAFDHVTPGHGRQPGRPAKPAATYGADAGHKEPKSVIASTRGPATATERPFGCGRRPRRLVHIARSAGYRVPCDPRAVTVCHESAAHGQATSGVRRLLSRPNRCLRGERYSVIPPQSPSSSPGSRPLPKFEHRVPATNPR